MKRWSAALGVTGVGFFIAGTILLGILGGRWLDSKLNSEPFFIITGLILGVITAFLGMYNMLRPFIENDKDRGKG